MHQVITLDQAAEALAVSRDSVRQMIARGDLPAYRVGLRQIRIRADDLERVMRPIPPAGHSGDAVA